MPAILFEDDDLLIVDKPAGLVVHPSYKNPDGTLLDALCAIAAAWPPGGRPSLVGRLDKYTSGLVVVAKHPEAHAALQRALASPTAEKLYLAIVHGTPPDAGTIDLPLAHDPVDRRRRVVVDGGARSVTEFRRLECGRGMVGEVSLVQCRLRTGRRHQIRAHLATRGWPIVGDRIYGEAIEGVTRHALHAWRVVFDDPFTHARVDVESPVPQDFCSLLYSCFAETTIGSTVSASLKLSKNVS